MARIWTLAILMSTAAAAAFVVGGVITRPGIGISPDSIVYIAAAKSVMLGQGITMPAANGRDVPLTHFPPVYPLVLALLTYFFGHAFLWTAKGLNIFLFGANTTLVMGWIYRRTKNILFVAIAAVISISALDLLRIYAMAWSEPLFLFLTFGGLLLLDFYLERPSYLLLLGAAFLSAAAVLTRYAGIAGVGAGVLILFFCQKKPAVQKLKESAIFGVVSGLPIALWLLRNYLLTHDAANRKFVFHPVWQEIRNAAQSALSLWLFQDRLPLSWSAPVGVLLVVFFVGLSSYRRKPVSSPISMDWAPAFAGVTSKINPHLRLLIIFSFSYIFLMAVIAFFFEAQLLVPDEYERILCPLHIAFLLTGLTALSQCVWPRIFKTLFSMAAVGMMAFFVHAAMGDIRELSQDGQQFASADWQTSPTIEYVRHLPPALHVYTNGRMPIYLYANRPCFEIPPKILLSTMEVNPDYQKTMAQIAVEVRQGIAVVVDFTIEDLPQFPTISEWKARLHKAPRETADGAIFAS